MGRPFYLALVPWLTFTVAARSAGLRSGDAALVAAAVALASWVNHRRLRQPSALSVFAVFFFTAFAAVSVSTGHLRFLERGDRAIVFAGLALYFLASLTRQPLTLTYAKHTPTPDGSTTRSFRRHHVRLTLQWSLATGSIALSLATGALLHGPVPTTVFNWFVPIALISAVISRPTGLFPNAGEETVSALNVLDSFLSKASARPPGVDTAHPRPHVHLVPGTSFNRSPRKQVRSVRRDVSDET